MKTCYYDYVIALKPRRGLLLHDKTIKTIPVEPLAPKAVEPDSPGGLCVLVCIVWESDKNDHGSGAIVGTTHYFSVAPEGSNLAPHVAAVWPRLY